MNERKYKCLNLEAQVHADLVELKTLTGAASLAETMRVAVRKDLKRARAAAKKGQ